MTNYLDVNVDISPGADGRYNVRASSDGRTGNASFKLPFLLAELADTVFGVAETARGIGRVGPGSAPAPARSATDYGIDMFNALFQGDVAKLLIMATERARNQGQAGVRVRLSMDLDLPGMAEVACLPWELLCTPDNEVFALSNGTIFVRGLDVAQPIEPRAFVSPLRILVLMSNPRGVEPLDLEKERKSIEASWAKLRDVQVDFERPVRKRILDKLREHDYHVLHYMGHGDFAQDSGGKLVMETEDGDPDLVSAGELVQMLDREPLRLVFLNACKSGTTGLATSTRPYAGVAVALIKKGTPAVVAMQFPISDKAANSFAETFYASIALQLPVDVAVCEGRKMLNAQFPEQSEWATPVLYMRSPDGNLFTPADAAPDLRPAAAVMPLASTAAPADNWAAAGKGRLKLFLATPDQDREPLHQQLAAALGMRDDCAVIAEVPIDDARYSIAAEALLREADLCIHLLGANAGRRIDVDDGQPLNTYPLHQLNAGRKLAKSQIVLFTPEDKASIGNATYAALVAEIETMERDKSRFEFVVTDKRQMFAAIVAKIEEIKRARAAAAAPATGAGSHRAYIDAHQKDAEHAFDLFNYLATNKVDTNVNTSSNDTTDNDPALDQTVRNSDLYVIVAGDVDPEWVISRQKKIMRSATTSRSKLVLVKYAAAANVTAPPISASRLGISRLNDSDSSWLDALFPKD